MTIKATLQVAEMTLVGRMSTNEAKFEAQLLLQQVLKVNLAWLIAHADDALSDDVRASFDRLIKRRLWGEPIAYILGYREFYGLPFKVTSDTLIPRPDTETLVNLAITKITQNQSCNILDLGTGSGAIGLTIAKYLPKSHITAVDVCENALNIALENAKNLAINNVTFILSDWFERLSHRTFDLIISNPPYIEMNDLHLTQGDVRFEPINALVSGPDGLDDIRHIITNSPYFLNTNGWLMLEHGYNQADKVRRLLIKENFIDITSIKDLGNHERVTVGLKI